MYWTQFLRDIKYHKLRGFLTVFGIVWGTVAVVLLLSFGESFQNRSKEEIHRLGERVIYLSNGKTTKPYKGLSKGRSINLKEEDTLFLKREIKEIISITPIYRKNNVIFKNRNIKFSSRLIGVYPLYGYILNITFQKGGRFINYNDIINKRRVVLLGDELKRILFRDENAIGNYIYIENSPFLVIGILTRRSDEWFNNQAFIPFSTFSSTFGDNYLSSIIFQTVNPELNQLVKKRVYIVLGKKYKFDPEDTEAIHFWDSTEFEKKMKAFFIGFRFFFGVVGTFTLIVGGIGVANIMNLIIEDRKKEIGIKMAIGAKKRFIMLQFIFETLLFVFIGGIIGFIISFLLIKLSIIFRLEEYTGTPNISLSVSIVATLVLGTVGFFAGYFPAKRASNMNPIDALRE